MNFPEHVIEAAAKAWDASMGGRYHPHEVEELSDEVRVILTAAHKAAVVTEWHELIELPEGAVIRDKFGDVMEKRGAYWCSHETADLHSDHVRKYLPARVLSYGNEGAPE